MQLVDVKGTAIVLAALLVVALLCAIDLKCSGDGNGPSVMARIKGELASGRKANAERMRESIAIQLRDLRALNKRLVKEGDMKQSRRVTAAIIELEKQYESIK